MKKFLPSSEELPESFKYPKAYLDIVDNQNSHYITPWRFIGDTPTEIPFFISLLHDKYNGKTLIPFARCEDSANGDLACFDGDDLSGDPRVFFHVFNYQGEIPDWDNRYHLKNFLEWLKEAYEDHETYQSDE